MANARRTSGSTLQRSAVSDHALATSRRLVALSGEAVATEALLEELEPVAPVAPVAPAEAEAPAEAAEVLGVDDATVVPAKLGRVRWLIGRKWYIVALLVIAALVAFLVVAESDLTKDNAVNNARTSALAAARTDAVELGSYNYRHLSADFGIVKSHSTPSFRASFTQSSDSLASLLAKYHATARATVVAAGIVSASTSKAVVLVFLNQTVSNTSKSGGPSTDHSRVEITLLNVNGHWLIDKVNLQ
jgi:Mce-associated membrane protein